VHRRKGPANLLPGQGHQRHGRAGAAFVTKPVTIAAHAGLVVLALVALALALVRVLVRVLVWVLALAPVLPHALPVPGRCRFHLRCRCRTSPRGFSSMLRYVRGGYHASHAVSHHCGVCPGRLLVETPSLVVSFSWQQSLWLMAERSWAP